MRKLAILLPLLWPPVFFGGLMSILSCHDLS